MKLLKILFGVVFALISGVLIFIYFDLKKTPDNIPVQHKKVDCNNFQCLKENFENFYHSDYEKFFTILDDKKKNAISNNDPSQLAEWISIYSILKGNVEVEEYMSEELTRSFLLSPELILQALLKSDQASQKRSIQELSAPNMVEIEEATNVARYIEKYKEDIRFQILFSLGN